MLRKTNHRLKFWSYSIWEHERAFTSCPASNTMVTGDSVEQPNNKETDTLIKCGDL